MYKILLHTDTSDSLCELKTDKNRYLEDYKKIFNSLNTENNLEYEISNEVCNIYKKVARVSKGWLYSSIIHEKVWVFSLTLILINDLDFDKEGKLNTWDFTPELNLNFDNFFNYKSTQTDDIENYGGIESVDTPEEEQKKILDYYYDEIYQLQSREMKDRQFELERLEFNKEYIPFCKPEYCSDYKVDYKVDYQVDYKVDSDINLNKNFFFSVD